MKGGPFGDKKIEKSRTVPKKNRKGGPLVSSGFVGYVKKVKNERGTLWRQKNRSRTVPKKNRKGGL